MQIRTQTAALCSIIAIAGVAGAYSTRAPSCRCQRHSGSVRLMACSVLSSDGFSPALFDGLLRGQLSGARYQSLEVCNSAALAVRARRPLAAIRRSDHQK